VRNWLKYQTKRPGDLSPGLLYTLYSGDLSNWT
jgi:hypothetical protein